MKEREKLIIEQLKQGNENAYKYIYEHHYVSLCHVANEYVNDRFIAETIVGDMIFHLWEIRETLNITTSIRSYLLRAVRNRCLNHLDLKREKKEVAFSNLNSDEIYLNNKYLISEDHPLGALLEQELESKIHDAINNLPDECRNVFKKSRFENKKYEEIAQELSISVNTVKYHIKNALASLYDELGKYLIVFLFLFY